MELLAYGLLFVLALLISATGVYAFFWASKNGQFSDLEAQARSIFDENEPEGQQTDFFPGKAPRHPISAQPASRHDS